MIAMNSLTNGFPLNIEKSTLFENAERMLREGEQRGREEHQAPLSKFVVPLAEHYGNLSW